MGFCRRPARNSAVWRARTNGLEKIWVIPRGARTSAARRACSCPRALMGTEPWPEILPLMFSSVCPCRTSITSAMQLPFRDCVGGGARGPFLSVCKETRRYFLVENRYMIPYHSADASLGATALAQGRGRVKLRPRRRRSRGERVPVKLGVGRKRNRPPETLCPRSGRERSDLHPGHKGSLCLLPSRDASSSCSYPP